MSSNDTIVNVVLHDLVIKFQGQTSTCFVLAIKNMHRRRNLGTLAAAVEWFLLRWERFMITIIILVSIVKVFVSAVPRRHLDITTLAIGHSLFIMTILAAMLEKIAQNTKMSL